MSCAFRATLVFTLALFCLQPVGLSDDIKPAAGNPELATADQLFRAGKFEDAETSYQSALKTDSKLVPARVGLVRVMLRQQPSPVTESSRITGAKGKGGVCCARLS